MSLNRSSKFFEVLIEAYKETVRRVTAHQGPSQTFVPPRAIAVSLQGGIGAHIEETVRRVTSRGNFLSPRETT